MEAGESRALGNSLWERWHEGVSLGPSSSSDNSYEHQIVAIIAFKGKVTGPQTPSGMKVWIIPLGEQLRIEMLAQNEKNLERIQRRDG